MGPREESGGSRSLPPIAPDPLRHPGSARQQASIESRWSWWVAGVGVVMVALSFGAVTSIPILLKPLARYWNTGASTIALVHTSAMMGAAVGGIVLGRMLDRLGFFRIALVAAGAIGLGLVLVASADSLLTFYLVYALLIGGIGQGAFFGPLAAAVSQWFDRHRGTAIAIVACGQSLGGLLLPPLMSWGVEAIGWRATLMSYGITAGLALMAGAFVFRRVPPLHFVRPAHSQCDETGRSLAPGGFLMLGACMALSNHASFMVIAHLTAFGEERGLAPIAAAGLVSAMLGVSLFSRLCIGQLSNRWSPYQVLLAMSILLALGVVCLANAQGRIPIGLGIIAIGLAFGGYLPGYAILVRELFPAAQAGRRIAEIYFFAFVAAGIGSWTSGWLRDLSGTYILPFWTAAASASLGAALLLQLRGRLQSTK